MKLLVNNRSATSNVEQALSYASKLKGLLGRKSLPAGLAFHIPSCNSIHTFFMSVKIDIIMTDAKGRVVLAKSAVPPWRVVACLRARDTFEFASGFIAKKRIKKGDRLLLSGGRANEKNKPRRTKA